MNRALAVLLTVLVAVLGWSGPAAAHVLIDQATPRGDGSVDVALTFDHSCDDSPTVELTVGVPDGTEVLGGTGPEGWSAAVEDDEVRFTGPGIGSGAAPRFVVTARLTGAVGETLLFPTQQTCADGDGYAWDDASESEERPAPRIVATAAVLAEVVAPTPAAGQGPTAGQPGDGGAGPTELFVAIGLTGLGVLVGARVLLRRAG